MDLISSILVLQFRSEHWFLHLLNGGTVGLGISHICYAISHWSIKDEHQQKENKGRIAYSCFAFLYAFISHKCITNKFIY